MNLSANYCIILFAAVQQERKPPPEKDVRSPLSVSTSTQKIYIRKDFTSNSASVPMFTPKVMKAF